MNEQKFKLIKKGDKPQPKTSDDFIRDHELGLLHLLIKKNPERAREIINKLAGKVQAA